MIKVDGLMVTRIPINGKETLRVMKNGQQLWSGSGLPSGYTLLEYIESTGQQYINTGFKPNQNTRVVIDFQMMSSATGQFVYGARNSSYQQAFGLLISGTTNTFRAAYGTTNTNINVDFLTRHNSDQNKNICTLSGVTIDSGTATFSSSYNLYLFAGNRANTVEAYSKMRMYSCQIYDNGNLIRDYIPCMDPNGVCGLFDKVNREFCKSNSSTQFTGDTFKEVEYIESTGTQYINTGIIGKTGLSSSIEAAFTGSVADDSHHILSSYVNGKRFYLAISHLDKLAYGYGSVVDSNFTVSINTRYSISSKLLNGKQELEVNGTIVSSKASTTDVNTNIPLYMFAFNNNGTPGNLSKIRLYSCKIYESGTLVRDFIPVKGIVSGVYGLYDKVNKQFYSSATSTPFTGA